MKIELNLDSSRVKGGPYILNPRITITRPLGVLKIIYYLIITAFCISESFAMLLGMEYFTFRGNMNLSTCCVGEKPSKGLSKPNQLVEIESCCPTPTHEC